MHSNNEVGTIQPIREIVQVVRSYNARENAHVLVHTDAAQSIGKVCFSMFFSNVVGDECM